ncbi:MAG: hypothetical protein Q4B94_09095 [Pseudomonadota bacterium]|nr:hypothetical protein [Pseudomonadota bacterium]
MQNKPKTQQSAKSHRQVANVYQAKPTEALKGRKNDIEKKCSRTSLASANTLEKDTGGHRNGIGRQQNRYRMVNAQCTEPDGQISRYAIPMSLHPIHEWRDNKRMRCHRNAKKSKYRQHHLSGIRKNEPTANLGKHWRQPCADNSRKRHTSPSSNNTNAPEIRQSNHKQTNLTDRMTKADWPRKVIRANLRRRRTCRAIDHMGGIKLDRLVWVFPNAGRQPHLKSISFRAKLPSSIQISPFGVFSAVASKPLLMGNLS